MNIGDLRVLQVVLSLSPGGAERLVIDISRRLHPSIPTTVCCLDDAGVWADDVRSAGIEVIALGRTPGFHPALGLEIARVAAERHATVVHCHQYSAFVYSAIAGLRRPALRIVFTEHGRFSDAPPSSKRMLVNRVLGRRPDTIVAVSDELRRYMLAEGFPAGRVGVVHNGVEPGPLPTPALRLRARDQLALPADAFVVGTVARLDPVKNLGSLLDGFAELQAAVPGARLVIVGEGPERTRLEWRISEHRLARSVHVVGLRSDARDLMAGFDVYVNSSVTEGVSLTLLEAMSAGLATVATSVGGTPEIVSDGVTGLLVPARQPSAMAAALRRLYEEPGTRLAFGVAGRARAVQDFSMDRMMEAYIAAYRGEERRR